MYAGTLLEVARLVGLSQSDIARELAMPRTQINRWSLNKRMVPQRHQDALIRLVFAAVERAIRWDPGTLGAMALDRDRLAELLALWQTEGMAEGIAQAGGGSPLVALREALDALTVFQAMTLDELSQPGRAQQLQTLGATLVATGVTLARIGPLHHFLHHKETSDEHRSHDASHADDRRQA